ncbi:hypothetical protein ACWPM1_02160 [Tsuneonella sp. HG249]
MSSQTRRQGAKAPISAHPAFPAIVALWFAGLLGLGSMVMPPVVIERVSNAGGIASLGEYARTAVALAGAALGALAGLAIARRVAAATGARRTPAAGEDFAKAPLSAPDELGEDGFDAEPSLAVAEDFESAELVEDDDIGDFDSEELPPAAEISAAGDWISEDRKREALHREEGEPEGTVAEATATPADSRPLGELAMVELVERLARALQQHRDRAGDAADMPGAAPVERPLAEEPAEFDTAEPLAENYPSLLSMRRAPPREPGDNERALREALQKLERMSGAA